MKDSTTPTPKGPIEIIQRAASILEQVPLSHHLGRWSHAEAAAIRELLRDLGYGLGTPSAVEQPLPQDPCPPSEILRVAAYVLASMRDRGWAKDRFGECSDVIQSYLEAVGDTPMTGGELVRVAALLLSAVPEDDPHWVWTNAAKEALLNKEFGHDSDLQEPADVQVIHFAVAALEELGDYDRFPRGKFSKWALLEASAIRAVIGKSLEGAETEGDE